ncbi:MAG TPA: XdhC family protein [Ktedonobacteraceae bacterium]|nr:XdhC family protein [Ktedonobacteraceae bacterium]
MPDNILELAYQLEQAGEPFVLATVVWREQPTSAHVGARAIIQTDGRITGWVGGSCTQPVAVREAQRVLREGGEPFLLRLGSPEIGPMRRDVRVFPMTCTSGGALDIYMEPHLPQPQLLLIGDSPVIAALSTLAAVLDFSVVQLSQADMGQVTLNERTSILVASHGEYDEDALEQALRSPARYVGMVGSNRRAEAVRDYLRGSGLTEQQIARLKVPAGLDIGAATPEEIAASILAELVQVRRRGVVAVVQQSQSEQQEPERQQEPGDEQAVPANTLPETALDPVCGMIVETATARHRSTYDGREFYFCCPACKRLFERNPQEYLVEQRER